MPELCLKSRMLSGYLEMLIEAHLGKYDCEWLTWWVDRLSGCHLCDPDVLWPLGEYLTVINPQEPFERGCQLSLLFSIPLDYMVDYLKGHGAVVSGR